MASLPEMPERPKGTWGDLLKELWKGSEDLEYGEDAPGWLKGLSAAGGVIVDYAREAVNALKRNPPMQRRLPEGGDPGAAPTVGEIGYNPADMMGLAGMGIVGGTPGGPTGMSELGMGLRRGPKPKPDVPKPFDRPRSSQVKEVPQHVREALEKKGYEPMDIPTPEDINVESSLAGMKQSSKLPAETPAENPKAWAEYQYTWDGIGDYFEIKGQHPSVGSSLTKKQLDEMGVPITKGNPAQAADLKANTNIDVEHAVLRTTDEAKQVAAKKMQEDVKVMRKENPQQYMKLHSMVGAAGGVSRDDDGNWYFDPGRAIMAMTALGVGGMAVSKLGVTKRMKGGPAEGSYMRGGADVKPIVNEPKIVAKIKKENIDPEWDQVASVEEAQQIADSMQWAEPLVENKRYGVRHPTPDKETGTFGNAKTKYANEAYPKGRNTWEKQGCGRGQFCRDNQISAQGPFGNTAQACYGGKCYAEDLGAFRGRSISEGTKPNPLRDKELRAEITDYWKKHGIEKTQEAYPDWSIKQTRVGGKDKIGIKAHEDLYQPRMVVSARLQNVKGQDMRLGVDTDGSGWLANPEVMDGIMKAEPNTVTVYSSAYHKPPPPHELSGRTMINVTVSGWHPLPETLKRIRWAEEARNNGWNVILRKVTADPDAFPNAKANFYNRFDDALESTDFFVMEQPLHEGATHGKPIAKTPACCQSKVRLNTCDSCETAEGLGKGFKMYYGLEEGSGEKLFPGLKGKWKAWD